MKVRMKSSRGGRRWGRWRRAEKKGNSPERGGEKEKGGYREGKRGAEWKKRGEGRSKAGGEENPQGDEEIQRERRAAEDTEGADGGGGYIQFCASWYKKKQGFSGKSHKDDKGPGASPM